MDRVPPNFMSREERPRFPPNISRGEERSRFPCSVSREERSWIPNMSGEERGHMPELHYNTQRSMENFSLYRAPRGPSVVDHGSPLTPGLVDSSFRHTPLLEGSNSSSPMQILEDIDSGRDKSTRGKGIAKSVRGKGHMEKANWDDQKHGIFVRLCLEQKLAGNKPSNTVNKVGYINLERDFHKQSGCHYVKSQLKNHWDSTRRDWQAWKALAKETGLGWDENKKTYAQDPEWWANFAKKYPGGEKFMQGPLQYEDELDSLFLEGTALGDDTYVPSSGVIPEDDDMNDDETGAEYDENITQEGEDGTTEVREGVGGEEASEHLVGRKRRGRDGGGMSSKKKPRLSTGDKIESAVREVCEAIKLRSMGQTKIAPKEDPHSIENVLDILEHTPGVVRDSPEWFHAIDKLMDADARRLFVALKSPFSRAAWIAHGFQKDRT